MDDQGMLKLDRDHPKLAKALQESKARVEAMSQEEYRAMIDAQRASWVRGEMGWPKPKFRMENGVKVYESYADYCAD